MKPSVSFWCNVCRNDVDLPVEETRCGCHKAVLQTGELYWYGKCPKCSSKVVRYITNSAQDPYFVRSRRLRMERMKMKVDLLQPGEYGFKTHYRKSWEEIEHTREALDRKQKLVS